MIRYFTFFRAQLFTASNTNLAGMTILATSTGSFDFLDLPVGFQAQNFSALGINGIDLALVAAGMDIVEGSYSRFYSGPGPPR